MSGHQVNPTQSSVLLFRRQHPGFKCLEHHLTLIGAPLVLQDFSIYLSSPPYVSSRVIVHDRILWTVSYANLVM